MRKNFPVCILCWGLPVNDWNMSQCSVRTLEWLFFALLSLYRIFAEHDLTSSLSSQKKYWVCFQQSFLCFCLVLQSCTHQIVVNSSQTKTIFLFSAFGGASHTSYIDFLASCWTLKRPQKEREGSWSNFWKGRADFAVQRSIPSIRQSTLLPQIMFSVLFFTLWCQAQLQQATELHNVAGYRTCGRSVAWYHISRNMYVYTYRQYLHSVRYKYKREQCLPIVLRACC